MRCSIQTYQSVPEPPVKTAWKRVLALSLSAITRAAPEITLASEVYWPPHVGTVGLYSEADKPVVVEYKLGEGGVLWLVGATPLTNAGLREALG